MSVFNNFFKFTCIILKSLLVMVRKMKMLFSLSYPFRVWAGQCHSVRTFIIYYEMMSPLLFSGSNKLLCFISNIIFFFSFTANLKATLSSESFMKHLREMQNACTNEIYRRHEKFNDHNMGLPGTFRKLSVD